MIYKITLFLLLSTYSFAQVKVGPNTINPSTNNVTLDIDSNGALLVNGIKPPIVSKQELINKKTTNGNTYTYLYNQSHTGTFVYVDDITITSDDIKETSNIFDKGIYYFNGTAWYGISSELKDYAIFAVGEPQSLIPGDRFNDIYRNISTKVSLSFTPNDKIAEIVAFLNTDGGTVIIGVKDDGTVIGVNNIDETLRKISDVISMQIEPNPQDEITTELMFDDGKTLIYLNIPTGSKNIYCQKKYGFSTSG